MANRYLVRGICAALLLLGLVALVPPPVEATHGWSTYHWRRTSSSIKTIPVRRYHSSVWLTRYATAIADWRKSAMTKIRPYTALTGAPKSTFAACPAVTGIVSSCDGRYGNTGWLGLAQVFISGGHIVAGRSWVNNTYYAQSYYNTVPWRQAVLCQEIGHTFGLGHVNVVFNNPNTGSCMDYTNDPDGGPGGASNSDPNNMHPNAHDYALINSRHNHIGSLLPGFAPDAAVTMPAAMAKVMAAPSPKLSDLGTLVAVGDGGRTARYEMDFGNGMKVANFVSRTIR